ncbi:MAG: hypothetical protein KGL92_12130, partial [Gammaproteobacteria bacterium]|nr:hypothetical protein [Gammaproteobacteria bacterium]
ARRRLAAARQGLRHAALALKLGEAGAAPELEARITCVQARIVVLQARVTLQRARDELEDALHAPLSGPEVALDLVRPDDAVGGGG